MYVSVHHVCYLKLCKYFRRILIRIAPPILTRAASVLGPPVGIRVRFEVHSP